MKEIQSNINIIGGGLIGAVAAYTLSRLGNNVVILEQKAKFDHKRILDKRTTAISEGTKRFLDEINIWKDISNHAEPIKKIQIVKVMSKENILSLKVKWDCIEPDLNIVLLNLIVYLFSQRVSFQ